MSRIRKETLLGRLTGFVGCDRRPAEELSRAEHFYVRLHIAAYDQGGNVANVELELSAAQVWILTRQFPASIMAKVSGIDRRQFMRAAGMSNSTVRHIIGDES